MQVVLILCRVGNTDVTGFRHLVGAVLAQGRKVTCADNCPVVAIQRTIGIEGIIHALEAYPVARIGCAIMVDVTIGSVLTVHNTRPGIH